MLFFMFTSMLFMLFFVVIFMSVQNRPAGDLIIFLIDILIAVGQVKTTQIATQRQINGFALVDRLRFGTQRTAKTLKVSGWDTVINHVHNAARRAIGVHQSRRASHYFDLLNVIERDIDRMVGTQGRDIAHHCAIAQNFDPVTAHTPDDGLTNRRAKIGVGHAQQGIHMLTQRLYARVHDSFAIQNVDRSCC